MEKEPPARLYPEIEPYRQERLPVGDGHVIYIEECGNPSGLPVLLVHGGPGGGSNPTMRRYHDTARYRIILFDQRGCGRSTPHASLAANTTWHLVGDMERIRAHLGIERWQVFGGSWGSTLSLAYAQTHPERVSSLILRGIFLLRQWEIGWFYQDGCSRIFPDAWKDFERPIPPAERTDMLGAYHKRLTGDDREAQLEAAKAWSRWEGATLSLLPDPDRIARFGADHYAIAFARIESHYFMNRGFFASDDQLLRNAPLLKPIPGVIVHGRYDVCTPVKNAWDLKTAWPEADLEIVEDAGHAMTEPGIISRLVAATNRFSTSSPR